MMRLYQGVLLPTLEASAFERFRLERLEFGAGGPEMTKSD